MRPRRILLLIVCLELVGCGSNAQSPAPTGVAAIATASPALTLTPTPIATPLAATPVPQSSPNASPQLKLGSVATVVTDGLRVRSQPEVSDASEKLTPLLERGQHVFVVKGPVSGSGFRWYEVQPFGNQV